METFRMVRGGSCRPDTVLRSALLLYAERGRPGVSVFADASEDGDLVRANTDSLPHPVVRFGWVRCLVERGFEVEQTGRPMHHTVWLPDVRTTTIAAFLTCFEPAVPNPVARW